MHEDLSETRCSTPKAYSARNLSTWFSFCNGSNNCHCVTWFKAILNVFFSLLKCVWKNNTNYYINDGWINFTGRGKKTFLKHWCSHIFISLSYPGWDMTPAVFLVILCLGVVSGASEFDLSLDVEWEEWKIKYGKSYTPVGIQENVQRVPE